jgi:hypothetical protein
VALLWRAGNGHNHNETLYQLCYAPFGGKEISAPGRFSIK